MYMCVYMCIYIYIYTYIYTWPAVCEVPENMQETLEELRAHVELESARLRGRSSIAVCTNYMCIHMYACMHVCMYVCMLIIGPYLGSASSSWNFHSASAEVARHHK